MVVSRTVEVKEYLPIWIWRKMLWHIDANVNAGFAFPWAGVTFFPSAQPMQAVDLSAANTLKFKVRGDGKTYTVGFTMPQGAIFGDGERRCQQRVDGSQSAVGWLQGLGYEYDYDVEF